uniref:C3H1-type domain-containing protein n=1 Tax=Stomoxys calcitrans TaxID=35570 RepID=A0A1I8NQ49_STOCA
MNKKERLHQLDQLHKMCMQELVTLQTNLQNFIQTSTSMVHSLKVHWPPDSGNGLALMVFDNFLTCITNVMNLSRKFNLQLSLYHLHHNVDTTGGSNMFRTDSTENATSTNRKEICENNPFDDSYETSKTESLVNKKTSLYPAEEIPRKELDYDFVYSRINIKKIYKQNHVMESYVTYLKDVDDLTFYAIDFNSEFVAAIAEVSSSIDLYQYNQLPPENEIFGLVLDKRIIRAVRTSKAFYDQELEETTWPCYLLDFGEVQNMKMGDIKYKLTDKQKNIPALALLCQLRLRDSLTKLQRKLQDMEYQQCHLKIIDIKDEKLIVDLVSEEMSKPDRNPIAQSDNIRKETNPFREATAKKGKRSPKELTEEELQMLHEETPCTSNALTAVMGYNPKDEKRICRFYDPKTESCFKGATCKQEHIPLDPEGWTKDVVPAVSHVDNRYAEVIYPKGSILTITPTYIGQLNGFYAQINDPHHNNNPLIWDDEDVPTCKRLQRPPHLYELVLACYEDGLWYRAKITGHDDDYKMFNVFYVDYGNCQVVHLRNLAKCDASAAHIPFQAKFCRLAGVMDDDKITDPKRKDGVNKLLDALLNQTIEVKVVSHYEYLFISFVDEKHLSLMDHLVHEKYIKIWPVFDK